MSSAAAFPGGTAVWCRLTSSIEPGETATTAVDLSREERQQCDRFRREDDRRDYAAAHGLLRTLLVVHLDRPASAFRLEPDRFGRPLLVPRHLNRDVRFSLSHTRGLVACAAARRGRIGIDAARVRTSADSNDGRPATSPWLSADERAQLDACTASDRAARRTELWTLKEAFSKAIGLGASFPWASASFDLTDPHHVGFRTTLASTRPWSFRLWRVGSHYRVAVAISDSGLTIDSRISAEPADLFLTDRPGQTPG
jgi:4'-phosphopantetheinyl transferase